MLTTFRKPWGGGGVVNKLYKVSLNYLTEFFILWAYSFSYPVTCKWIRRMVEIMQNAASLNIILIEQWIWNSELSPCRCFLTSSHAVFLPYLSRPLSGLPCPCTVLLIPELGWDSPLKWWWERGERLMENVVLCKQRFFCWYFPYSDPEK